MAEYLPPELAKLLRNGLWGSKQAVVRIQLRYGSGRSMLLEAGKKRRVGRSLCASARRDASTACASLV